MKYVLLTIAVIQEQMRTTEMVKSVHETQLTETKPIFMRRYEDAL